MIQSVITQGAISEITISGRLTADDYRAIVADIQAHHAQAPDGLRLIVRLRDFEGWTIGGVWEELKLDALGAFAEKPMIKRLAVVGPRLVFEGDGAFAHPLPAESVGFFAEDDLAGAREWVLRPPEAPSDPPQTPDTPVRRAERESGETG